MAVVLRMDNGVKEQNSSVAFTEETILLTYMSSPYLFCASLFSSPESINYLGSQRDSLNYTPQQLVICLEQAPSRRMVRKIIRNSQGHGRCHLMYSWPECHSFHSCLPCLLTHNSKLISESPGKVPKNFGGKI